MSCFRLGSRVPRLFAASLLALTACSGPAPERDARGAIDLGALDPSVRPGADFFLHANGGWLRGAEIAPDRNSTGVGERVGREVEQRTQTLLEDAARSQAPAGSALRKIGDYYAAFLDESTIEARGLAPLEGRLGEIANIHDRRSLAAYLGAHLRADVDPLNDTNFHTDHVLGLFVEQDLNDASRCAPYLLQGGLGMPERSYYLAESPRMVKLREAYGRYLAALLRLAGVAAAETKAQHAFDLETKIARTHATRTDSEDVGKANNPWPRTEFTTRAPGLDWDAFFAAAKLDGQGSFLVWHPTAVTGLAALAASESIETWKEYLTARAIDHLSRYLPRAFGAERFAFYGKALQGSQAPAPRARAAMAATNAALGETVGRAYVERWFPPETKRAVAALVQNLVTAFEKRITALEWMSPATKKKALEKLATLVIGVGYPDTWRDDSGLTVLPDDALGNFERAERFEYESEVGKLGKPVDRHGWAMVPQIVNAVNLPVRNALNFPAGILSPPYFDPHASSAANYGAIGAIIGHEISHSFDDQGAKFDAHGRFVNWWTPADLEHFEASGKALAAQFSAYKPFPDQAVDGNLTLSENIADLAGLAVAYDAWRVSLGGVEPPPENGFTGDQVFFLAYAQSWQNKTREATLRNALATDGHAPAHQRVLTVRNLDAWYRAFDVAPGDALWLAPGARVRVW